MYTTSTASSDVGRKRSDNEDRHLADDDLGIYAVCDGMGGHAAGEVAAQMTIARLRATLADQRSLIEAVVAGRSDVAELAAAAANALRAACGEVHAAAAASSASAGMCCTATALVVAGSKGVMAHVGDSRLYLLRDRAAHQLSADHTMASELAQAGLIAPEEVRGHQYAHVLTRAIGTQASVRVDTLALDVLPGDRYLLCSDGLSDYIEDAAHLTRLLGEDPGDLEEATDRLVDFALTSGGRDNVTVVLVRAEASDDEAERVTQLGTDVRVRLDALRSVALFDGLSLRNLSLLLRTCEMRSVHRGEVLISEGESAAGPLVVLGGRLSLSRAGRSLGEVLPPEVLGLTTLLTPRPARVTVTAAEEGSVLLVHREALLALARKRPFLGVTLLERLGRRLAVHLERGLQAGGLREPGDAF